MSTIIDRVRREPAIVTGIVGALIALGVAFGLELTGEQTGAIMAFVSALLAVVVRQQVTPYVDVVEQLDGTEVVAGPANDIVGEGAVVREITSETYVGEHRA